MSEYLKKKELLEWLERDVQAWGSPDEEDIRWTYNYIKEKILSGAFDAEASEVQRLRAALVEIKQLLNENRENDGAFQSWNHMQAWKVATQALSTTTEPINAEKVERVREGDGNDA